MSNQLYSGQGRDINVFAGQSLAVSSITGTYTATIIAGAGLGTALATDSAGGATYGPYSGGVTVRLKSGEGGLIDYEAAVSPVLNYAGPARLGYSAAGDTSSVVDTAGNTLVPGNYPRNRLVSRASTLVDMNIDTSWTFVGTGVAYSVSPEVSRRSAMTRKIDMTGASADALLTWSNATGIQASATDKLLSFDVYIPEIVQPGVPGGVGMVVTMSNTNTYAAPGTTWVLNTNYLRQGWNTITLCGKDADGALGSYRGTGTLPYGMSKTGFTGGTAPLDWALPIKFIQITFTYAAENKRVYYMDEIRIPAKIKPFVCLGFDSTGYSAGDDSFTARLAPFLTANSVPSYFTACWRDDGPYQDSADGLRRNVLYNTHKWDSVNHSYSHGAGASGAFFSSGNTLTVSGTGTLVTLAIGSGHTWAVGTRVLVAVFGATGASSTNANGVFVGKVTSTSNVTYAITGGTDGVATGTVKVSTYLNTVFNAVAVSSLPIILPTATALAALSHEFSDNHDRYARSNGFIRGANFAAYPNNSVPDMRLMEPVAEAVGIKVARGLYGTTCRVSEFGIDNPLAIGSFEFNSESTGSTLTDAINALQGAINRGEGLFMFGHFLIDAATVAVVTPDSPPGKDGNPSAASSLSWYIQTLEKLVTETLVPLRNAGTIDLLSASEVVAQLVD